MKDQTATELNTALYATRLFKWSKGVCAYSTTPPNPSNIAFSEELRQIDTNCPDRLREFIAGRKLAHEAIAALGLTSGLITRSESGAPRWPQGVVGSISHKPGFYAAIAAPKRLVGSVGIDVEPNQKLPEGVLRMIASSSEMQEVRERSMRDNTIAWDRLLFCAKEAFFKLFFGLWGQRVALSSINVTFHERENWIDAKPPIWEGATTPGLCGTTHSKFFVIEGYLIVLCEAPRG